MSMINRRFQGSGSMPQQPPQQQRLLEGGVGVPGSDGSTLNPEP